MADNFEPEVRPEKPSRVGHWLDKAAVIAGFVWWIIRVLDWVFVPRGGLTQREFPKYEPGKPEAGNRESLAGSGSDKKDPA